MQVMSEEEMLTPAEVAKKLRLSEPTVLRLLRQGVIPGIKIAGSWRIDSQEFQDYLNGLKKQQKKD